MGEFFFKFEHHFFQVAFQFIFQKSFYKLLNPESQIQSASLFQEIQRVSYFYNYDSEGQLNSNQIDFNHFSQNNQRHNFMNIRKAKAVFKEKPDYKNTNSWIESFSNNRTDDIYDSDFYNQVLKENKVASINELIREKLGKDVFKILMKDVLKEVLGELLNAEEVHEDYSPEIFFESSKVSKKISHEEKLMKNIFNNK